MAALTLQHLAKCLGGEIQGGGVICPGPGHSPGDRSLSVKLASEAPGGFIVHSFAGDDPLVCKDYVRERAGMDQWEPRTCKPAAQQSTVCAEYIYRQADGVPYLRVQRYLKPDGSKTFSQSRWTGSGWAHGKPSGDPLPYRLPELTAAKHVPLFVVEGEKDVDRLASIGLVATTSPEGAGKWRECMAGHFAERDVLILPDNDEPGRKHAEDVAASLAPVATSVRVVALPGLPFKGDVSDWLDTNGGGAARLVDICMASPLWELGERTWSNEPRQAIRATPFSWVSLEQLPQRAWLYGRFLIRGFVSVMIGAGGVSKSSMAIVDALAMVTNRRLLYDGPHERARVWLWNGEDPIDELQRRIAAAAKHHVIQREEIEGWLFVDSGRDTEIIIARQLREGVVIAEPVFDAVVETIKANKIDVLILDPFVTTHAVAENDNGAIDRVAKAWAKIAHLTDCAILLIHHARKTGGVAVEVEDARGAVALVAAARAARTLNPMDAGTADKLGIEPEVRFSYVRADDGKSNLAPRSDKAKWHRIVSIPLGNGPLGTDGDQVGVVTRWRPPDPTAAVTPAQLIEGQLRLAEGDWRENNQSNDWAGGPIAEILGLDISNKADKAKVTAVLRRWISEGYFYVETRPDPISRKMKQFLAVGKPAQMAAAPPPENNG